MREHAEKLIADYPKMMSTRSFLKKQIKSYVPLTVEDMIESITFSQPGGERVQTSSLSDKTCIAPIHYRDLVYKMNEDEIGVWVKEYNYLDEEILEQSIRNLPGDLYDVMCILVLDGDSWDKAQMYLDMSRMAIARRRKEARSILTTGYQKRASRIEAEILS